MDELSNKGDGLGITEDGELGLYSGDKLLDSVPIQGGGEGTEEEWLQSLVGPQGEPGPMGPQRNPGEQGPPGEGISVSGAQPGQTVRIAAVDENGIPTAWEPADFPGEKN